MHPSPKEHKDKDIEDYQIKLTDNENLLKNYENRINQGKEKMEGLLAD